MNLKIFRTRYPLLLAALLAFLIGSAHAGAAAHLSGSYQVLGKTQLGAQTRVRLQLHLVNHGKTDLSVSRVTLWRFGHTSKSAVDVPRLLVRRGATESTTQELTVPTADYRSWTRGAPLTLLVSVESPNGRKSPELVRLSRISRGKAN
jgi:hypothetical protein